jgi:hypothetical protein
VTFFAVNAASFFVSGLLIGRVRRRGTGRQPTAEAGIREGFAALRPRPVLAIGVLVLGVAVTISAGRWIAGVPMLVRDHLHGGAGRLLRRDGRYAADPIVSSALLAHRPLRRKALASLVAWTLYLPAYGVMALGRSLWFAVAGAFTAVCGQSSALVLLVSAGAGGRSGLGARAACSG